jgi:CDP-diacylglycerol--glycerol-3-phosphate 3-phosphatidyltransferase
MQRIETSIPKRLLLEWIAFLVFSSAFFFLLWVRLFPIVFKGNPDATPWAITIGVVFLYFWVSLGGRLKTNVRVGEQTTLSSFGWGTAFTLTRLTLIAALSGFLWVHPVPQPLILIIAWLYTAAILTDFIDGALARFTNHNTELGQWLDMHADSLGVIVGSYLAFFLGKLPWPYLIFAFARYIFLVGLWLRRKRGQRVDDMPDNSLRRVLAGIQLCFIPIAMYPVFKPAGTQIVGLLLLFPFIGSFLYDYAHIAGWQSSRPYQWFKQVIMRLIDGYGWLGVLLRAAAFMIGWYLFELLPSSPQSLTVAFAIITGGMLIGLLPRLLSIGYQFILMASLAELAQPLWIALASGAAIAIMLFGSGWLTLWVPEAWFARHRVGDPQ